MATKKKKGLNDIGSFVGAGAIWQDSQRGGSKPGGLPSANSYEPYQPEVEAYSEGTINPGDTTNLPSMNMSGSRAPNASVSSAERRLQARQGYNFDVGDVNRRLMQAAMQYGNAPKVTQYGVDDSVSEADVTADPNSVWGQIGRYYTDYDRNINEDLNNRNSFFSGANLERHQRLNDEVGRQRGSALNDYNNTIADLNSLIMRSRSARDAQLRQADYEDMLAEAARAQAMGAAVAPASGGGGGGLPAPEALPMATASPYSIPYETQGGVPDPWKVQGESARGRILDRALANSGLGDSVGRKKKK